MPAGRPSKLTPELEAKIIERIRAGNYKEVAAQASGINQSTLWRWLKDPRREEFCKAVKQAESEAEIEALERVRAGTTGTETNPGPHWTSAMTFLERRWPARWGRRDPDHKLKRQQIKTEIETLKAKLTMLQAGADPDAKKVEIVFRDYLKPDAAGD